MTTREQCERDYCIDYIEQLEAELVEYRRALLILAGKLAEAESIPQFGLPDKKEILDDRLSLVEYWIAYARKSPRGTP